MTRKFLLLLAAGLLATAVLVPTGCGQGEKEKYIDDFKPLNDRLLRIGAALGGASLEASPEANVDLATELGRFASDLRDVNRDIAALDTPADLRAEAQSLTRTIDVVVTDLEKISGAARRGDRKEVAAATMALADDSNSVNRAQNNLARATGADIGPR